MIRVISFGGKYAVFDSESLALVPVGALAVPMVPYLTVPMPADCPVSIRYALAQYPSPEISSTYRTLREAWEAGLLFAPEREAPVPVNRVFLTDPTPAACGRAAELLTGLRDPGLRETGIPDAEVILDLTERGTVSAAEAEDAVRAVRASVPEAQVFLKLRDTVPSAALCAACETTVFLSALDGTPDPSLTAAVRDAGAAAGLLSPAGLLASFDCLCAAGFRKIDSQPASPEEAKRLASKLRRMKDDAPAFLPFRLRTSGGRPVPVRAASVLPDGTLVPAVPPAPGSTPFRLITPDPSAWSLACAEYGISLLCARG